MRAWGVQGSLSRLCGAVSLAVAMSGPVVAEPLTDALAIVPDTSSAARQSRVVPRLDRSAFELRKGLPAVQPGPPIYIRIFKETSTLEVWDIGADGIASHRMTYPICTFSGGLGPKQRQGDYQSPEGFYAVPPSAMKPNSSFHLAFNIGYPNALDRAHGRTGNLIMVHGVCSSSGCFSMTNPLVTQIYAHVRAAHAGGQGAVPVHVFPFAMTPENIGRHASHPAAKTWAPLADAFRAFEATRRVPTAVTCERRYVVEPHWAGAAPVALAPTDACPAHTTALHPDVVADAAADGTLVEPFRVMADGPRRRLPESIIASRGRNPAVTLATHRARQEKVRDILERRRDREIVASASQAN
jgi:murein L,D-transpeptidase YafK